MTVLGLTTDEEFQMGKPKVNAIPGSNCCGKPKGCTNQNPGCAYLQHPYKKWLRGEITLIEMNEKLAS